MTQPVPVPGPAAAPARAAIIVLHGIGEQRPYQTLDAFTRGLAKQFGLHERQLEHHLFWRDGRSETALRFTLPQPVGRANIKTFDLYEHYWADQVERKIGLRAVLTWLAKTSLTPLLQWGTQPAVLLQEKNADRRVGWLVAREVFRAALLLVIAAVVILPFVYAASEAGQVTESGKQLWTTLRGVAHPVWGIVFGVLATFAVLILKGGYQLMTPAGRGHAGLSPKDEKEKQQAAKKANRWAFYSVLAAGLLGGAAWYIYGSTGLDGPGLLSALWAVIRPTPVWIALVAAGIGWFLRGVLISYVGDVTIYVTADERSVFFGTRQRILKRSTDRVRSLLASGEYAAVYIAGHSLGSVIAYDTVNYLSREVRAEPAGAAGRLGQKDLDRLYGLLTFGSPLDKIYYFFRTQVPPEETVRAQILASLHGFKQKGSDRNYGDVRFARYDVPVPRDFRWLNVYSPEDPVSGYLDFYQAKPQKGLHYFTLIPGAAHIKYWGDKRFYRLVAEWL